MFWRITLPTIRWGLTYGVILSTARAIGEFGAVAVVSGKVQGRTETMTLYVEDRYQSLDLTGAYAAAVVLALIGIAVLVAPSAAAAMPTMPGAQSVRATTKPLRRGLRGS